MSNLINIPSLFTYLQDSFVKKHNIINFSSSEFLQILRVSLQSNLWSSAKSACGACASASQWRRLPWSIGAGNRPPHYTLIASMQIRQHFNLRKVRFRVNTPRILKALAECGRPGLWNSVRFFLCAWAANYIRLNINLCWIISSKLMVHCLYTLAW